MTEQHFDTEKYLEHYLVRNISEMGGIALKQTSQYHRGIPDRLVILPGGRTVWVELKTKGQKPTKLQTITHEELRALGHDVRVIDNITDLIKLIVELTDR